jgi:hypothetical protein
MMQTASLVDLRERPGDTLLVLHIQPPLLDGLRALVARLWPGLGKRALVVQVDRGLYLVWMLVYAAMAVLVFHWLRQLLADTGIAALAALAFLFHPAALFYATYLEGTLLTSFGILWLCYAMWRIPARGATLSLGAAYLLLFLVRSIFQWPALLLVAASSSGGPRRSILLAPPAPGGHPMLKQHLVFGSTATSLVRRPSWHRWRSERCAGDGVTSSVKNPGPSPLPTWLPTTDPALTRDQDRRGSTQPPADSG